MNEQAAVTLANGDVITDPDLIWQVKDGEWKNVIPPASTKETE